MRPDTFDPRQARKFDAPNTELLCLDFTQHSRSIIKEVVRGIGCRNDAIGFGSLSDIVAAPRNNYRIPDVIVLSLEAEETFRDGLVRQFRRLKKLPMSRAPIILLSTVATPSLISLARNSGVDEILLRPVSPLALNRKMKQAITSPREFIYAKKYVGPCRRRNLDDDYGGPRRRGIEGPVEESLTSQDSANDLAMFVSELREALDGKKDNLDDLIKQVNDIAIATTRIADMNGDKPLAHTAFAVKKYLDGALETGQLETKILETGINALTQLTLLPDSLSQQRHTVAKLMGVAVQKRLKKYKELEDGGPYLDEASARIRA